MRGNLRSVPNVLAGIVAIYELRLCSSKNGILML